MLPRDGGIGRARMTEDGCGSRDAGALLPGRVSTGRCPASLVAPDTDTWLMTRTSGVAET